MGISYILKLKLKIPGNLRQVGRGKRRGAESLPYPEEKGQYRYQDKRCSKEKIFLQKIILK